MKNKLWLVLIVLINTASVPGATAQGIKFQNGKWDEIKAMSVSQNKPIFIDFGTVWCAPCKELEKTIFPQKEAGDFYNQNFICVQIDAEKGEGVMLARKFGVGGFPTMIYTNAQEKVVYRITGMMNVTELVAKGKIALTPQEDYIELKAKYIKGELSKDELHRYLLITKTKGSSRDLGEVLNEYVRLNPVVNADMFQIIADNVQSPDSEAFSFLEHRRKEFASLVGNDKIETLIRSRYIKGFGYREFKDEAEYKTDVDALNAKILLTEQERLKIASDHYYKIRDNSGYMSAASALASKYYQNDDEALSMLIGATAGLSLTQDYLLVVKSWAEHALSLNNNALNALSLALTYKNLKNKKQALKYIDLAIENSLRDKDNEEGRLARFKTQIENTSY